jgi:hypothetical protein
MISKGAIVNRIHGFKLKVKVFFLTFLHFSRKLRGLRFRLLWIERSTLKRGIQQCQVHWNTIFSNGAKVNRIREFKHKIRIF